MIYLDHNATTPPDPKVVEAMMPLLRLAWGNPSSAYRFGAQAKAAIEDARMKVAGLVESAPCEVLFTSSASEANNTAIVSALSVDKAKRHLVCSAAEHSSVLRHVESLSARGFESTMLSVGKDGLVSPAAVRAAIRADTAIVSVMWANNETGVISPIGEIGAICRDAGTLFHTDAVQAVGKIPVSTANAGCDYLSLSGHKLGAPKGVGALIVRTGAPFEALLVGGKQEGGRRGGTESVAGIAALGIACELAASRSSEWARIGKLLDALERRILTQIEGAYVNGAGAKRLPNTLNFGVPGVDGDAVVAFMDRSDICVSSGSACLQSTISPSHVVLAMTGSHDRANEAVRVSLGLSSTETELDRFVELLREFVAIVR